MQYLNFFIESFFIEAYALDKIPRFESLLKRLFENLDSDMQICPDIREGLKIRTKIIDKLDLKNTKKSYNEFLEFYNYFDGDAEPTSKEYSKFRKNILESIEKDFK